MLSKGVYWLTVDKYNLKKNKYPGLDIEKSNKIVNLHNNFKKYRCVYNSY